MALVVADGGRQRLGRQEGGRDGVAPPLELVCERAGEAAAVFDEGVTGEAELLCAGLLDVDGGEEGMAFGGERGLGVFGVAELADAVRIAARLDDATRGVDVR